MANYQFSDNSWDDYTYWINNDKKIAKQIQKLLKDISRNGNTGIAHPEPLKGNLTDYYSRHIDDKNRLIYKIENDTILIYSCKGHYDDK